MDRLGIEHLSVFGLPPIAFVNLAADLGCRYIATGLRAIDYNPHGYPAFSLKDDPALRREMIAAMRDRGVSISLGEGFIVRPGMDIRDRAEDLDVMREHGVKRINACSMDPDRNRSFDQLAALAELVAESGGETCVEFAPALEIADFPTALAAVRHVGRKDFRLCIDTMHFGRTRASIAELRALDRDMIGYVQLSDATMAPRFSTYMEEAMFERMVPGTGELPLIDILAALPRHLVVGLEVPLRAQAEAGVSPHERLGRCVEAARGLLAKAEAAS